MALVCESAGRRGDLKQSLRVSTAGMQEQGYSL